jgi:bifunctional aspartokinase / homoserine dehydrogenase 1
MHVMKFGGSSVGTPAKVRVVIDIVQAALRKHRNLVVVLSAFQGVTDQLIALSRQAAAGDRKYHSPLRSLKARHRKALIELIPARSRRAAEEFVNSHLDDLSDVLHGVSFTRELTPRTLDYVMSFGELLSSFIVAEAFRARGVPCRYADSRQLIKADESFGAAHVRYDVTYHGIRTYFRKHPGFHVVPGFIASTTDNDTVTLGRGGSDLTASIFGAALSAREIQIWTDVDGVMTADPRKVEKAFSIPRMTYAEAMEMSHFGAKVIHPPTMQPALDHRIPLRIKNTFNPTFEGTLIGAVVPGNGFAIKGISSIDEIALIRMQGSGLVGVSGIGRRVFGALASRNINVFLTSQASSEYSLCMAVLPHQAVAAKQVIEEEFRHEMLDRFVEEVTIESGLSTVAVVGENMRNTPGIAARLFQALGKNGINVVAIAQGSSELNISTVVAKPDEAKALNALHDAFFLSGTTSLNIFLVGTGQIGGTLLRQISRQRQTLLHTKGIDLRVVGIANRRHMLFQPHGIPGHQFMQRLEEHGTPMNLNSFVSQMKAMNLPHSVFVDCTAAPELVARYDEVLSASISIVTPNKRANAGPQEFYERLRRSALKHNARFLYETNVGAGLPVINTINDLVAGGDTILKIEGVLSGTLSYLFNSFDGSVPWSEIVLDARRRGFTEPDPRDDLNGKDVGRKLLILARESGHALEFRDITITSLLPPSLARLSIDGFLRALPSLDRRYEQLRAKAAAKGQVLRYLASWGDGRPTVALRAVSADHPAAVLTGGDVSIALTTVNCREHPVIIKGPGAGPDVTATAVLADILRIGYHRD